MEKAEGGGGGCGNRDGGRQGGREGMWGEDIAKE